MSAIPTLRDSLIVVVSFKKSSWWWPDARNIWEWSSSQIWKLPCHFLSWGTEEPTKDFWEDGASQFHCPPFLRTQEESETLGLSWCPLVPRPTVLRSGTLPQLESGGLRSECCVVRDARPLDLFRPQFPRDKFGADQLLPSL